jgi:hypothetical protein
MAGTANVHESLHWQYRINGDVTDPALLAGLLQVFGEVGTLKSFSVVALPDVRVAAQLCRGCGSTFAHPRR